MRFRFGRRLRWGRLIIGRQMAVASSISTASLVARLINGIPDYTTVPSLLNLHRTPEQGYHLTEDLADKAIAWVRQQKALMPDKPFFVYFAPGATHAPHHVPKEWADKYKGKFAHGWDKQREITFQKQKQLGVIPQTAELTKRHAEIPAWDAMDPKLKPVLEREMEVYAGFMEHTDHHVGRLIDAIKDLGIMDDTLIFVIIGDNGASAEGTIPGTFNEMIYVKRERALRLLSSCCQNLTSSVHQTRIIITRLAGPGPWTRRTSGRNRLRLTGAAPRNGTIVHWPKGIKEKDGIRNQFCHVIDVAPTILEAAGIPEPTIVNSVMQSPMEGKSMLYSFNDAKTPERHEVQYFEMFGNRGIYYKGWSAVTKHRTPWVDRRQRSRLSIRITGNCTMAARTGARHTTYPSRCRRSCAELQRLWLIEATKYNVIPLDDRGA